MKLKAKPGKSRVIGKCIPTVATKPVSCAVWAVVTQYEDVKRSKAFMGQRLRHMEYDVLATSIEEAMAIVNESNAQGGRKETIVSASQRTTLTQLPTDHYKVMMTETRPVTP